MDGDYYKKRRIALTIYLDYDLPAAWDNETIEFYLNESSFCLGTLLDKANKYADEHGGCICNIAEAHLADGG